MTVLFTEHIYHCSSDPVLCGLIVDECARTALHTHLPTLACTLSLTHHMHMDIDGSISLASLVFFAYFLAPYV